MGKAGCHSSNPIPGYTEFRTPSTGAETAMKHVALLLTSLFLSAQAMALSLSDLTQQDTATAMKEALTQGAQLAVSELGKPGGFSNNPDVRIELPGKLGSAARTLKMMGMG